MLVEFLLTATCLVAPGATWQAPPAWTVDTVAVAGVVDKGYTCDPWKDQICFSIPNRPPVHREKTMVTLWRITQNDTDLLAPPEGCEMHIKAYKKVD
jgi:hypothetical protein